MEFGAFAINGQFLRPCPSFEAIASALLAVASPPMSVVFTGVGSIEICVYRMDDFVAPLQFRYLLVSGCFLELTPFPSSGLVSSLPPRRRLPIPLESATATSAVSSIGSCGKRDFITRFTHSLFFGQDCALPSSVGSGCDFGAFSSLDGTGPDSDVSAPAADVVSASRGIRDLITRFVPRLRFSSDVGSAGYADCDFSSEFADVNGSSSTEFEGELTTPIESGGERSVVGFSGARVCAEVGPIAQFVVDALFYRHGFHVVLSGMDRQKWHESGKIHAQPADLQIITSDGHRIAAHSSVLASASPVLENLVFMPRKNWNSERIVSILGVQSEAVFAFLQFIYSSKIWLSSIEGKEAIEKYGVQLLLLAHKYKIDWLKKGCEIEIGEQLKANYVVDILQIAKLCGASRLYQTCLNFLSKDFSLVEKSDGWRFVQKHDPRLEFEILQFLQEIDQRNKRWKKRRKEQENYEQLSEAMECLEHICTEGCTSVGPRDKPTENTTTGACTKFSTCNGLQILIRHFATCNKKLSNGVLCLQCKRMKQLFRLHSSLCNRIDNCKVPLCKQFKMKVHREGKGDNVTWNLLVKRVGVVRVMSSWARRKRPEQLCGVYKYKTRHIQSLHWAC